MGSTVSAPAAVANTLLKPQLTAALGGQLHSARSGPLPRWRQAGDVCQRRHVIDGYSSLTAGKGRQSRVQTGMEGGQLHWRQ